MVSINFHGYPIILMHNLSVQLNQIILKDRFCILFFVIVLVIVICPIHVVTFTFTSVQSYRINIAKALLLKLRL